MLRKISFACAMFIFVAIGFGYFTQDLSAAKQLLTGSSQDASAGNLVAPSSEPSINESVKQLSDRVVDSEKAGCAHVDVEAGKFTKAEIEAMENICADSSKSTKTAPDLSRGIHEANILTIVLDVRWSTDTLASTSDIFGNTTARWDPSLYGFTNNAANRTAIENAILAEVQEDYFDELAGTVAGPVGQDLRIDFILGDIGVAPPGLTNYYYMQLGDFTAGPHGAALGVAGGSVVRNAGGTGPNSGIVAGDVVGSIFVDNIQGLGGLAPANALSSGDLGFTTFAITGTTSHEAGHTLSLSHINKAGSVQPTAVPPLMGTGAIDLLNQDRIAERSFSLSGVDGENANAPRQHIQQLVGSIGLHSTLNADLSVTQTDSPDPVIAGNNITYTITASNAGPDSAASATLDDTLPAGTTFVSLSSPGGWTCTTPAVGATGAINCTNASFGVVSDNFTLIVKVNPTIPSGGTITNTATVSSSTNDPNPGGESSITTTAVDTSADLSITKTDGVATAVPGGSVTYTITASNAGPSNAASATVADTFPASITGVTWTCVGAGGGTCAASGTGNINATVNLPAGGSVTYTAVAAISASATGTLANTATVTSAVTDPTPVNSATDTDTLSPSADLSITKTDGVTTVSPGGTVTYTITASNAGPSNVTGATVADTFPATLVTPSWTCVGAGGGTCTASGTGNINDTVNLPSGGSVTYTATATVSASATVSVANTATVTAPGGVTDPVPGDTSATDTDTIVLPNLTIDDVTVTEGNSGTVNALFTVSLSAPAPPSGVTFDIANGAGSATAASDYAANSATGVTIAPGNQTATFTVVVNGDTTFEPDEVFEVTVTNVTAAAVTDGVGLGRITNDDAAPTGTFCSNGPITINDETAGSPYPSTVNVSGLTGLVKTLTVDINGLNTNILRGARLLLVAPTGERFILMAGVGGGGGANYATYRIDDAAAAYFSQTSVDPSGSYRPNLSLGGLPLISLPAPAPAISDASPYNTTLSSARGLSPNGTWNLYVADRDTGVSSGSIAGGWCLNITTAATITPPFNQVFTGSLGAGDATQTGRVNRFAVISLPTAPKGFPGTFTTTGSRFYDSYTVTNNNTTAQPVIASIAATCGTNIFALAYLGSFNPASLGTNYLADPGSSFTPDQGPIWGFMLNPGQSAVFVIHEVNTGTGCGSYGLRVEGNLNLPVTTAPVITAPANQAANEGTSTAINLGSFVDPDDGPWNVSVDWGDGSPATTFSSATAGSLGTQNHTYVDNGTYTASVTVTDGTPLSDTKTFQVAVTNVVPSNLVLNITPPPINEGQTVSLSGTFADPGTADTHVVTINWGDGSPVVTLNLGAGVTTIPSQNHVYDDDDPAGTPADTYGISMTITDDDGGALARVDPVETVKGNVAGPKAEPRSSAQTTGQPSDPADLVKFLTVEDEQTDILRLLAPNTANVSTLMPIGGQTSTFPGNIRGYWFTAPRAFHITGLRVPTTASSGPQNIAVLFFNPNTPPPVFSATTNAFTTVFKARQCTASEVIPVNIFVPAGQVIGILGSRGGINSYTTGDYATTIAGMPVQLERLGMQFPLETTDPQNIWREFGPSTSISRVEMYYDLAVGGVIVNNVAPTAVLSNGGPYVFGQAGQVTLSGQADPSAADLAGLRYAYDFDNDGTFDLGDGTYAGSVTNASPTVPAAFLASVGPRVVKARVMDDDLGAVDYTTTITVNKADTTTAVTSDVPGSVCGRTKLHGDRDRNTGRSGSRNADWHCYCFGRHE